MPKIVGPPPIANLDGIIDILTNPEKYAKYLAELKGLHDTIKALCENYDTKERAQSLLHQAMATHREAAEELARCEHEIMAARAAQEQDCAAAEQRLAEQRDALTQRDAGLREAERVVSDRERAVGIRERAVEQQAAALAASEQAMTARASAIDQQEARIKKASEALTALGM